MPSGFDWQTEDHEWDERETRRSGRRAADLPPLNEALFGGPETDAPPSPAAAPPRRRRRLLYLATVGVLVVALAALLYWQLQRGAAKAEARLTTEVAASHSAILDADRRDDGELFVSYLSGSDRAWADAQQYLARHGSFLDRAAFGLSLTPSATVSPTVTLAPDLRAAELTRPQTYEVAVGNGLTETVTLQQTAVYRLGPDRWLFAPPDEEFWGETASVGGRYVQVTYPARDADLAEALARDLDAALAELCRDEACPELHLVLSTNPASLIPYDRPAGTWSGGSEIVMPTPTLFGRPTDDAGQRALTRVYGARVVAATLANVTGWQCCDNALFYGALLDAQLYRLGLRPWPVGAAEYARLAREPEALRTIEALWGQETAAADERLLVYTLVDFLVAHSRLPVREMQLHLLNGSSHTYWGWVERATGGLYGSQADFERDLLRYAAERGLDSAAQTVPLPNQVLQMVCRQSDGVWPALYRYDPATGQLTQEQELTGFEEPMIAPLPGQDGVVVFVREREEPLPITYLWRDGEVIPVYPGATDGTPRLIPLPPAPSNNTLLMGQEGLMPVYALLSLDDCLNQYTTCMTDPIRGVITYSPDGTHTLLATGEPLPFAEGAVGAPMLYLGDAQGQAQVAVETGISPFWLSDDVFGYVATRQDGSGDERVVLRTISRAADNNTLPAISPAGDLFSVHDLEQLAFGRVASGLTIDRVLPNPTADELLVFTGGAGNAEQPNVALTYDLATAELRPRFAFADELFDYQRTYRRAYRFSPDGRWLAVSTLAQSATPVNGTVDWWVYVHATDGSLTRRYSLRAGEAWPAHWLSDWSADGRWLALTTDGYVRLVVPQEEYTLPIILPDMACNAVAWVEG